MRKLCPEGSKRLKVLPHGIKKARSGQAWMAGLAWLAWPDLAGLARPGLAGLAWPGSPSYLLNKDLTRKAISLLSPHSGALNKGNSSLVKPLLRIERVWSRGSSSQQGLNKRNCFPCWQRCPQACSFRISLVRPLLSKTCLSMGTGGELKK